MKINLKKKIISITNNILKNTLLIMLFALKLPLNIERAITKQRAMQKISDEPINKTDTKRLRSTTFSIAKL